MNKYAQLIIIFLSALALPLVHAAEAKSPTAVPIDSLQEGSPVYICIKYLMAMQASDYDLARTLASGHRVASAKWSHETNPAARDRFYNNLVFSEIQISKEDISPQGDLCEIEIFLRAKRKNSTLGWEQTRGFFLKKDDKWIIVHFAEYKKGELTPEIQYKSLYGN